MCVCVRVCVCVCVCVSECGCIFKGKREKGGRVCGERKDFRGGSGIRGRQGEEFGHPRGSTIVYLKMSLYLWVFVCIIVCDCDFV